MFAIAVILGALACTAAWTVTIFKYAITAFAAQYGRFNSRTLSSYMDKPLTIGYLTIWIVAIVAILYNYNIA